MNSLKSENVPYSYNNKRNQPTFSKHPENLGESEEDDSYIKIHEESEESFEQPLMKNYTNSDLKMAEIK